MSKRAANIICIVLIAGAILWAQYHKDSNLEKPLQASPTVFEPTEPIKAPEQVVAASYHSYKIVTTDPSTELRALVGPANLPTVLRINRTNSNFIRQGTTVTIPDDFAADLSPFPHELTVANNIPKLIIIAQRVQAVGLYEKGKLIRWAPTSTGKKATPTRNGLFSTNWKGKEVISSFDDEWVLKWNFNIVNFEGIGLHQYEMPGVPASHSCVRLFENDAKFIYDWADEWILAPGGASRLAYGTPVILFGDYAFDEQPPWKNLPTDPNATTVSEDELTAVVQENLATIQTRQQEREQVLSSR